MPYPPRLRRSKRAKNAGALHVRVAQAAFAFHVQTLRPSHSSRALVSTIGGFSEIPLALAYFGIVKLSNARCSNPSLELHWVRHRIRAKTNTTAETNKQKTKAQRQVQTPSRNPLRLNPNSRVFNAPSQANRSASAKFWAVPIQETWIQFAPDYTIVLMAFTSTTASPQISEALAAPCPKYQTPANCLLT